MRGDGRQADELRSVRITRKFLKFSNGSVLIEMGDTKVICTATVEEGVPPFLKGTNKGWITAEYSMLPGSSKVRIRRESSAGKVGGRTHEIQRLIGRSLRSVVDLNAIGERTIWIDCDVIQADGGTRTASITGAFVALVDTIKNMKNKGTINTAPILDSVAAVSVGVVNNLSFLDLTYEEDSKAHVDMNVIMTGSGKFVEVQGTAETCPFSKEDMEDMISLASRGTTELTKKQMGLLGSLK
ncbi:MAG: ribonuclease PH [Deltaproteobacteria bacterium]|nr:ribonuclease PH [Deltaproteobacteria bacterium]